MVGLFRLLLTALLVAVVQNLVITGGFGISEALRFSSKPGRLGFLSALIAFFSVLVSIICVLLEQVAAIAALDQYLHFLVYSAVLALLYLICCAAALLLKAGKKTLSSLGIAAINTLVMAIPLINYKSGFNVFEAVGAGLGAGASFAIAVTLVNTGIRRLRENPDIPESFSGSPALFIYTALIALGLTALSGRAFSI